MYETHFGLKNRPFHASASGVDIHVGPRTAAIVAEASRKLAAPAAVIVLTGPAGVGKSTLVKCVLEELGAQVRHVRLGRAPLRHDQVLEFVLRELGVDEIPGGTVQQYLRFRSMLDELAEAGIQVVVTVEDAAQIGDEALSDLQALTSPDNGHSNDAAVVLMSSDDSDDTLAATSLAQLKARVCFQKHIEPFTADEMIAYFRHCFRVAGGNFDGTFAPDAVSALCELSRGIPREANSLAESAMETAAARELDQVTAELVVAMANQAPADRPLSDERAADEVQSWDRDPTMAELRPDLEALERAIEQAQLAKPSPEHADESAVVTPEPEDDIPELVPEITLDEEIEAKIREDKEEIQRVVAEAAAKVVADKNAVAMIALAKTGEVHVDELPNLDELAAATNAQTEAAASTPESDKPATQSDVGDRDDEIAETLRNEEFTTASTCVNSDDVAGDPANEELQLVDDDAASIPAAEASPQDSSTPPDGPEPTLPPHMDPAAFERLATVRALNGAPNVAPPPPPNSEAIVMSEDRSVSGPVGDGSAPGSIEDQIMSMTQSLRMPPMPPSQFDDDDDDTDEEEKGGFFRRFRRS